MTKIRGIVVLFILLVASSAWGASTPQFAIKGSQQDANGLTLQMASGTMRIEACGDHAIHVVVSPTSDIPAPKVPVVIQPCKAEKIKVASDKSNVRLSTGG